MGGFEGLSASAMDDLFDDVGFASDVSVRVGVWLPDPDLGSGASMLVPEDGDPDSMSMDGGRTCLFLHVDLPPAVMSFGFVSVLDGVFAILSSSIGLGCASD